MSIAPQYIGAHMSRANGYSNALNDARRIGANCVQLYTNAPQRLTFAIDVLKDEQRADLARTKQYLTDSHTNRTSGGINEPMHLFIHTPYTINLCDVRKMTLNSTVLRQQLEVCELAGGQGVVVHTGSQGKEQELHHAYETFVRTVRMAIHDFKGKSRVLLETCAGQGRSIGVKSDAFGRLYNGFTSSEREQHMGIVIDTCHVFAAGYDISTVKGVQNFYREFHHHIPFHDVRLVHLNDSKKACGTCVDRHEHLGKGFVFESSMDALVELFRLYSNVPFVLETHDKQPYTVYAKEIALCKALYDRATTLQRMDVLSISSTFNKKRTRKHRRAASCEPRDRIVRAFQELAEIYYSQLDNVRGDCYYEAAHIIDQLECIPTTRKELKTVRCIGDAIADKTIELLYTGKLAYLERLRNDESIQSKIQLLRVSGIGVKTYEQLVENGITNLQQLRDAYTSHTVSLTHAQELGVMHYDDLQRRIPRKETRELETYLQKWCVKTKQKSIFPYPRVWFVGSYRRGSPHSGDIDILLHQTTIDECIAHIQKHKTMQIVGFITRGKEKASFLLRIQKYVRRIDLLVTTAESFVPALVYFTGSKFFNIRMRQNAKEQGYVLNEHGLCPVGKGCECVVLDSEEELFGKLGMVFVEVEKR